MEYDRHPNGIFRWVSSVNRSSGHHKYGRRGGFLGNPEPLGDLFSRVSFQSWGVIYQFSSAILTLQAGKKTILMLLGGLEHEWIIFHFIYGRVFQIVNSRSTIYISGWWFQRSFIFHYKWYVIRNPLTLTPSFFKMVIDCTSNQDGMSTYLCHVLTTGEITNSLWVDLSSENGDF